MSQSTILTLPRELRDQIFGYCLLSPTRYIETVRRSVAHQRQYSRSRSLRGPHQYLRVSDCLPWSQSREKLPEQLEFVSLSLLRVCKKFYEETRELFWQNNTFYFAAPHIFEQETNHRLGGMAPLPRLLMASIRITPVPDVFGFSNASFQRVLETLTRRLTSEFSLKKVDLSFTLPEIRYLSLARQAHLGPGITLSPNDKHRYHYLKFLSLLKAASKKEVFERTVTILNPGVSDDYIQLNMPDFMKAALEELHAAWGPVFIGSKLVYGE